MHVVAERDRVRKREVVAVAHLARGPLVERREPGAEATQWRISIQRPGLAQPLITAKQEQVSAEAVVKAMGRTLAPRQPWADERSMALISQMRGGDKAKAQASFNADPKLYDVPLIAMWGFFRAQSAGSDRAALTHAVEVMELASPHFTRPELVSAIADARSKIAKMQ